MYSHTKRYLRTRARDKKFCRALFHPNPSFNNIHTSKMPKTSEISMDTRGQIVGMSNAGKSAREIGRELGISDSTFRTLLDGTKKTGSNENLLRSGRPSILTERIRTTLRGLSS